MISIENINHKTMFYQDLRNPTIFSISNARSDSAIPSALTEQGNHDYSEGSALATVIHGTLTTAFFLFTLFM